MANIYQRGSYSDPQMVCDACDMAFQIVWARSLVYEAPEYCPFCGDSIDKWIDELTQ